MPQAPDPDLDHDLDQPVSLAWFRAQGAKRYPTPRGITAWFLLDLEEDPMDTAYPAVMCGYTLAHEPAWRIHGKPLSEPPTRREVLRAAGIESSPTQPTS